MHMSETCIWFGQHSARVMIEEKEVPHFAMDVDPAEKEVSCWIASEAGKVFSVVWLVPNVKYPIVGALHLDGQPAIFKGCRSAGPRVFRYVDVSESSRAPFLFSPLIVTDDDAYLDTPSHSIGEIKLVISRTSIPKKIQKKPSINVAPPCLQKVHERSKKGMAHQVNYGTEIPKAKSNVYALNTLETVVTFIFRYRPLELLRANGIVPQNPKPLELQDHNLDTPSTFETSSEKGKHFKVKKEAESGPETEDSDEDSLREKALLAELEKIRKGKKLKDKRPNKKLKKEEKPVFIPGEIIDLT